MPPVGGLILAHFATMTIASFIADTFISMATSFVLSGLSKLVMPKPKNRMGSGGASGGSSASALSTGITTQVRQPVMTRKPLYGEIRVSGGILFTASSGGNDYLHYIIEVAPHEVEAIGEVWINDYSVADDHMDASGNVNTGRYSGVCRIKKHLGSTVQAADTDLSNDVSDWTSTHNLYGIAYVYVRLKWDQDKFPMGIPNISAFVKGKKIYDSRDTLTKYSPNMALIAHDYLLDTTFGFGASSAEIDSTFSAAAANVCEEMVTVTSVSMTVSSVAASTDIITLTGTRLVFQTGDRVTMTTTTTLPAGISAATNYFVIAYQRKDTVRIKFASSYANAIAGTAINITDAGTGTHTVTKNAEPRYAGAIQLDSANEVGENMIDVLTGMSGKLVYAGGTYRLLAGAYQTPTVYFDESDIAGAVNVQTKVSRRERFNAVHGVYISPINDGQPSDYPPVKNDTYKSEDNDELLIRQIDFPATQRAHTAQRLAKIELEKSRQEITWSADFNLSGMLVQAGDVAFFTIARFGWTDKAFEVVAWKLDIREKNNVPCPVVNMTLRETASANYDWNNGEETAVDPAPNTNLPDPFTVNAIQGLAADSEIVATQGGDYLYKILLSWTPITDLLVVNGGAIEIQFKKSDADTWRPTYVIDPTFSFSEVTLAAQLNEQYDLRVRAVNQMGVRSTYTSILGYVVGSSGGVGSTEDWGEWVSAPGSTDDYGEWVSSPGSTDDWGFFT